MTLTDLPDSLRAALAIREALRRLGYPPDSLFVSSVPDGVYVTIIEEGRRGDLKAGGPVTKADIVHMWPEVVARWNDGSDEEREAIWREWTLIWPDWRPRMMADLVRGGLWPREAN